ncbi:MULTISPECIES: ABC transporter substrate-binding protein [Methylobacterium]|uniref:ABC transporter substrate-binding protein n=1 Tax=Methylobacterium TaxID=407 RepID=UPI00034526C3|nr:MULTISPECIES: ABC transporter substrate-binding protein [Methylobacterium]KQS86318.1 ABC transporter permease [Methylobacterium sp. Leaf361]MBN4093608.1 ABC transporter substrate-binding protein [Methylobacterium sp. OT2]UIN33935.1 ABC transporter substrate-binding protein [Methylobacterium oryzae]SEF56745.1 amino acid/amide ABC transporter substrate-binding protein, HAAT family [Methylobacterium sp. 190mf]SEH33977.1 amino acid/amide ABC transporter substrate-binding protein, HAAT family [M
MLGRIARPVTLAALAGALMMGTAAAQTNVKIGILGDRSGAYSDISGEGSVVAAKLAVEDFKPEQHGLKVEIVSADHQNKPDVGAAIARQWYDRDAVDMITDGVTSSVALAISQVTKEKNKVFIDTGAGTADLTGPQCTPNTIHWVYDTVALANGTGGAMVKRGGNTWFFLTADYVFGQTLQRDTSTVITKNGGKVVGSVKTPFPTSDFSSFLLQAQGSGAKVIGLANAGTDTINAIKQAGEFGITEGGQALAGLLVFSSDVHSLGTKVAQGLVLTEPFYWDLNDQTRAFSDRFAKQMKNGSKPTANHAGVYSDVLHYLKAVAETKSTADGAATVAKMKAMPTDDPLFGKGVIRADGRKIHDMYLFEVKKPAESKGEWDLYKKLETIPGDQVFRPLNEGNCPLVKG